MRAGDLLAVTRGLLDHEVAGVAGCWPRACAFLGRQALETAVDEVWAARNLNLAAVSMRAQLLCLGTVLGDERLAGDVNLSWWALSRACHHHHYELPPTRAELAGWLVPVERLTGLMPQ